MNTKSLKVEQRVRGPSVSEPNVQRIALNVLGFSFVT